MLRSRICKEEREDAQPHRTREGWAGLTSSRREDAEGTSGGWAGCLGLPVED